MGMEAGYACAMNAMNALFAYPWSWALVITLPVLWWLLRQREHERLHLAREVAGFAGMQSVRRRSLFWQRMCLWWSAVFTVIASTGPQWGRDPQQRIARGRDIIIALDISRSMLAEDRAEADGRQLVSRLQRAKRYLGQFIDVVQRRGGHRLGLVWFAGQARLVCPLTDDYDHVRALVELAHPDYWGPAGRLAVTDEGAIGTSMRNALETALATHDPLARGYQDILLITDGDDQDIDPFVLVQQARDNGIRIHTLGVGRAEPPAYIPSREPGQWLQVNDQPVTTRRHDELLIRIARLTGGQYLAEENYDQPLVDWFLNHLQGEPQREWSPLGPPRPQQRSGMFFLAALVLLLIAVL